MADSRRVIPQPEAARRAVFVAFAVTGMAFAAFASRVPDIKHGLHLDPGELGVTLLAVSAGSVLGLPLSGWFAQRFGTARTVLGAGIVQAVGLAGVGVGVTVLVNRPVVMAALFFTGLGVGVFDVGMNLEGASVERLLRRSTMPHFHAMFSAATVGSALVGALLSGLHVPVVAHFAGASLLLLGLTPWLVRSFLPATPPDREFTTSNRECSTSDRQCSTSDREFTTSNREFTGSPDQAPAGIGAAWLEPRTLLIGVVVLAAAFTEGTANDWVAVAFAEGYDLPRWAGVLGFAVFLAFMTLGRVLGTRLLDLHGRVPVLRVLFVSAVVGCVLVVFGGPALAFVGAAVWGLGASLGFPVGMSAAADDPRRAAARMSVVSTIGYGAFLGGPPLLGFLGDHVGVLHALLVVGAMAVIALLAIPAVHEQRPRSLH